MKITAIRTLRADRFMYVKLETDEGLTGVGELHPASGTGGTPLVPIAAVEYCAEYLLGKDPTPIEAHWQHMFRRCLFRGGADTMAAIGAIDQALWDLKGKALGKPVYELLGGPTRQKVRLYTHLHGDTPDKLAEEAVAFAGRGFTALRLYPFGTFGAAEFEEGLGLERMTYASMLRNAEERVQAVREAVGPQVDLMIDVVNRLSPAEAISLGRVLEPYDLYFFEDPIEPENMDAWEHVADQIPIPLAMGERLYTIHQFRDLLNHKGAAYVRPDLSLAGGITNIKKIAALAEASYVGVVPHNPLSCVLTAACAHLDAAIHNIPVQEYPWDEFHHPKRDLVVEPLRCEKGYLIVPTAPGLGIELNEEAFPHYPPVPYQRPPLITPDGGLRDY
ncbi:MAG: galactonate dehydratase [Candidatus Handelsmanbacteria bacterium]|nr:galactonate dehydratase [Candidatus Handelsmanbacteria bacterium]